MVAFHFCFDLNHFGFLQPPQQFLLDPLWTVQRASIVTLFMFCAGVSQSMAHRQGQSWSRFGHRWLQIAACALLVSLATWLMFPQSWISFGVLHGLAVMVVLARLCAAWPPVLLLALALVALLLPLGVSHPIFDERWLQGVGLVTHKPITQDYAPVLPWMGAVLVGLALGPRLFTLPAVQRWQPPRALVWLKWLGQWPLTIYMVHQPLLWGLLWAAATMRG